MKEYDLKIEWSRKLAAFLDTKFKGPLGLKFGYDGLLGLIPGLGDLVTTSLGFTIIGNAALIGAEPSILIRMLLNLLIDNILSKIPFLGLIFDFFWKANTKNIRLLDQYYNQPTRINRTSKLYIAFWIFIIALFMLVLLALSIYLLTLSWDLLFNT